MRVLEIIGIIALVDYKGTPYKRLVISSTIVTSTTLASDMFAYALRVMSLAQIAILAAHGMQPISDAIVRRLNSKSMAKPVLPLTFLLCFTAMVPYSYPLGSVLSPPNEVIQQLYWIAQHYGFKNSSVLVCFDVIPLSANGLYYSDYYNWGLATVGDVLYDGPLLYLIQGFAD
jgi:hypothetical protein